MPLPKTPPPPLRTENVYCGADIEKRLVYVKYEGTIDATVTAQLYEWLIQEMNSWFDQDDFRATIFDFRNVKSFRFGNKASTREGVEAVRNQTDLSNYPIALVVKNVVQEVEVRMTLIGGDSQRKAIFYSSKEALQFINEWNRQNERVFDVDEELMLAWPTEINEAESQ